MRLLDTYTGQFVEKDPRDPDAAYAILSHTWSHQPPEQTHKQLRRIQELYVLQSQGVANLPRSRYSSSTGLLECPLSLPLAQHSSLPPLPTPSVYPLPAPSHNRENVALLLSPTSDPVPDVVSQNLRVAAPNAN